ncbi:hypothetical protein [Methanoculleus chikugoensis]|nr:hypothetical protein [Methanoculleus chikugoensis]
MMWPRAKARRREVWMGIDNLPHLAPSVLELRSSRNVVPTGAHAPSTTGK